MQPAGEIGNFGWSVGCKLVIFNVISVSLFVHVPSVGNLHHVNYLRFIIDGIKDSVVALPEAGSLLRGKLFAPRWTRVFGQELNTTGNLSYEFAGNAFKFSQSGRFDRNLISFHRLSAFLEHPQTRCSFPFSSPQRQRDLPRLRPSCSASLTKSETLLSA